MVNNISCFVFLWRGTFHVGTLLENSFSLILIPNKSMSFHIVLCHSKKLDYIFFQVGYLKELLRYMSLKVEHVLCLFCLEWFGCVFFPKKKKMFCLKFVYYLFQSFLFFFLIVWIWVFFLLFEVLNSLLNCWIYFLKVQKGKLCVEICYWVCLCVSELWWKDSNF